MPQSLGSLFVDLQANTGGFVSALSKAAYSAQQASKSMARDFKDLGAVASQTFGAFGAWNEPISRLAFTLETAGRAASAAMKEFGKFGGAVGPIASIGVGAAAGLAALGGIMVGIAAATAESASHLHEVSQSAGVSVETLSRFGFAARQSGVNSDQLATGLERLSKSAFAAASAPAGAVNAYTRLHIALLDLNGSIRPAGDLILDLAHKFATMPDGVAKTALAIEIFGRNGAEMIPFLNQGRDAIEALVEQADRLNVTMSGPAAEAAHKFEMNLGTIRGAAEGAANSLMEDFLPALNAVSDFMASHSEQAGDWAASFLSSLTSGASDMIALAGQIEELSKKPKPSPSDLFAPDQGSFFSGREAGVWAGKWGKQPSTAPSAPTASGRPDTVAELVKNLQAQAAAEIALASATDKSTSGMLLANAAREAENKISETGNRLREQAKALEAELADAKRAAAAHETGGAEHALKLQTEISGLQRMLAELQKDAPQIRSLYAEIASAGFGAKASKELEEATVKTNEETSALERLAAAYANGPGAIEGAQVANKLQPFQKQLADIEQLMAHMKSVGEPTGFLGSTPVTGSLFGNLQQTHDQLAAGIERYAQALKSVDPAEVASKIGAETLAVRGDAEAYAILSKAVFASAAARREAEARAAEAKFVAETPGASNDQAVQVYQNTLAQKAQEYQQTVQTTAAQLNLNQAYADEMKLLADARALIVGAGQDTIAIDAKIFDGKMANLEAIRKVTFDVQNAELLGNERIYEQIIQLTEEWDRAANAVGTLGEKFRAMANEIELESANVGTKFFDTFKKGVDDLSTQLAKLAVTGKANFKSLFDSILEGLLKTEIQFQISKVFSLFNQPAKQQTTTSGFPGIPTGEAGPGGTPGTFSGPLGIGGKIASFFGVKTPGAGGLPLAVQTMHIAAQTVNLNGGANRSGGTSSDGSSSSPFYSIIADSSGNPFDTTNPIPTDLPTGVSSGFPLPPSGSPDSTLPKGLPSIFSSASATPNLVPSALNFGNALAGAANGTGSPAGLLSSGLGLAGSIGGALGVKIPGLTPAQAGGGATSTAGPALSAAATSLSSAATQLMAAAASLKASGSSSGLGGGEGGEGSFLDMFSGGGSSSSTGGSFLDMFSGGGDTSTGGGGISSLLDMFSGAGAGGGPSAGGGGIGSLLSMFSGGSGGGGGGIGGLFSMFSGGGGAGGGGLMDLFSGGGAAAGGGISDLFDSLGSLAFMADGGRVSPGSPYIVGEKNAEVFVPDQAGKILPSISSFANSTKVRSSMARREFGGDVSAGMPYLVGESRPEVYLPGSAARAHGSNFSGGGSARSGFSPTVNINVDGRENADAMNRSKGQIHADMLHSLQLAHQRNK